MEITDRQDLGGALWAPQRDGTGGETWSYTLLTYLQPGDRVFHWHKSDAGEPALVGWSSVTGPLSTETKSWQARGTRGRARGIPTVGPAWVMPLGDLNRLDRPLTRTLLNHQYQEVLDVLLHSATLASGPAYSPFQNYGGRELRAQQGYLTKFPAALVALLFSESSEEFKARNDSESPIVQSPILPGGRDLIRPLAGQGYLSDAEKRSAVELRAVLVAIEFYEASGAEEIEILGKPYDLRVHIGGEVRHVEVKGSTGRDVESVQLTSGEVAHAKEWRTTDLVVVDRIVCWSDANGTVHATGGELRRWTDWTPAPSALSPLQFRYQLPTGGYVLDDDADLGYRSDSSPTTGA